jgi:hypothetical protein
MNDKHRRRKALVRSTVAPALYSSNAMPEHYCANRVASHKLALKGFLATPDSSNWKQLLIP